MTDRGWIWRSERITAVAPPGYEADPSVTAAIHSFDPGVIPIWRISVYIPPNEERPRQYVHHGIARHYPYQRQVRRPPQVDMPVGADFPVPNFLDAILEDTYSKNYLRSGPGDFMPWTWSTYYFCRREFIRLTEAAYLKRIEKRKARLAKERAAWEEELDGRKKEVEPWILKQMEKLSDRDWEKYQAFFAERDAALREGRPLLRHKDPKQTVLVGKAAARSPRSPFETYGRVAPSGSYE